MRQVIITLSLIAATAASSAAYMFSQLPASAGTAVIGEKSDGGNTVLLPPSLTSTQGNLLSNAYKIAKADGHKDPELVQAVLLQETKAGGMKSYRVQNPGANAYFGVMQISLKAALDVLASYPVLYSKYGFHTKTDDEIKANLILNERFNIEVGSKYLLMLKKHYGYTGDALLLAYNRGPNSADAKSGNDPHNYVSGARAKLKASQALLHRE